jgi:tRNA(Ile)-lysidine synthetase-like protein
MNIDLPAGKHVVAVSGGVDSVVLLDLLRQKPGLELIVAHFDHGIRPDSGKDERLVANLADKYGLKYKLGRARLGKNASEATARAARYKFLHQVRQASGSDFVVTAHHQDDLVETAVLNMLRGTGHRGLISIFNNPKVKRPLLRASKAEIIEYAKTNKLHWNEDSTNKQDIYLRNYMRNQILPKLSSSQRQQILKNVEKVAIINKELDSIIATLSQNILSGDVIDRHGFIMLPQEIADELVAHWLRLRGIAYDKKLVKRLSLSIKTAKAGTSTTINQDTSLVFYKDTALFKTSIRYT